MKLATFRIVDIHLFKRDVRLLGRFKGESPSKMRQVIVRLGQKPTDLAMKKGEKNWELEILLPPLSFATFASAAANGPSKCRFDRSKKARLFKMRYEVRHSGRSARATFRIK